MRSVSFFVRSSDRVVFMLARNQSRIFSRQNVLGRQLVRDRRAMELVSPRKTVWNSPSLSEKASV